jgi:hypothetical protein
LQDPNIDVIYGDYIITDKIGRPLYKKREIKFDFDIMLYGVNMIGQPAAFFSKSIYNAVGGLDINFNYFMDVELWLRIARNGGKFTHVKRFIATYRFHEKSKTIKDFSVSALCQKEAAHILNKYWTKRQFAVQSIQGIYYHYLRFVYRLKRQYLKVLYRRRTDIIPGKYFVWYFKKFKLR